MEPRRWVLVLFGLAGCVTSNAVRPDQLSRLDGYEGGGEKAPAVERQVETLAGDKIVVGSGDHVFLLLPGARAGGRFASIAVSDGVFDGRTTDGRQVRVPIDQVTGARVEQYDARLTGIAIGVTIAVLAAGALVFLLKMDSQESIPGRALRVRGKVVAAPLAVSDGWRTLCPGPDVSTLSPEERRALAAVWTDAARAEHASVPAFSRLSLTLMALGAPARLVERAHVAALEEIEHARRSFALATAYAEAPVAPGPIAELRVAPAVTARSIAELAEESLIDGCLIEGVAAAAAEAARAGARDPAVRATLEIIARDEASHVDLAWEVVGWCCGRGDADLRRHLLKQAHATPAVAGPPEQPPHLAAALGAHGCIAPAAWHELLGRTRTTVASRLTRMLAERPGVSG